MTIALNNSLATITSPGVSNLYKNFSDWWLDTYEDVPDLYAASCYDTVWAIANNEGNAPLTPVEN
jgi:ABC-type branched-subunit amino acid transport system substrate-binding protein